MALLPFIHDDRGRALVHALQLYGVSCVLDPQAAAQMNNNNNNAVEQYASSTRNFVSLSVERMLSRIDALHAEHCQLFTHRTVHTNGGLFEYVYYITRNIQFRTYSTSSCSCNIWMRKIPKLVDSVKTTTSLLQTEDVAKFWTLVNRKNFPFPAFHHGFDRVGWNKYIFIEYAMASDYLVSLLHIHCVEPM